MHFLTVIGGMIILIGGCMAAWPRDMCNLSQDADGEPIPPTPKNVRWMRVFGVALVVIGGILVCAGLIGVHGADDPVLF